MFQAGLYVVNTLHKMQKIQLYLLTSQIQSKWFQQNQIFFENFKQVITLRKQEASHNNRLDIDYMPYVTVYRLQNLKKTTSS